MTRERVLLEPCAFCGAKPGEPCAPSKIRIGVHAERLLAAGGEIRPNLYGPEYVRPLARRS